MDKCEEILKLTEDTSIENNEKMFEKVLSEYLNITKESYGFYSNSFIDKAVNLKQQYIYPSQNKDIFVNILKKYNCNMRMDVLEAMITLSNLDNPNKNSYIIKRFLSSPVINDISFNGRSRFAIDSIYGKFIFNIASYYFRRNKSMNEYIKTSTLPGMCHHHTEFMSKIFPNNYSVTSLCDYYFEGQYYHSYMLDKNKTFDLANNIIMDSDKYNIIFGTKEISNVLNHDLESEFEIIKDKTSQNKIYKLLKLALYKQFLQSINYTGTLNDAPKTYTI